MHDANIRKVSEFPTLLAKKIEKNLFFLENQHSNILCQGKNTGDESGLRDSSRMSMGPVPRHIPRHIILIVFGIKLGFFIFYPYLCAEHISKLFYYESLYFLFIPDCLPICYGR